MRPYRVVYLPEKRCNFDRFVVAERYRQSRALKRNYEQIQFPALATLLKYCHTHIYIIPHAPFPIPHAQKYRQKSNYLDWVDADSLDTSGLATSTTPSCLSSFFKP